MTFWHPKTFVLWSLAAWLLCAPVQALEWEILPDQSQISFHGVMLGVPVTGVFERIQAKILFDPDDLAQSRISVSIDMTSVNTEHDERDQALSRPEWFDSNSFMEAHFKADDFRKINDSDYELRGALTIKGFTQPVVLPFSFLIEQDIAVAKGTLNLSRHDFNIGSGEWADEQRVAFDVRVEVLITARAVRHDIRN